MGFRFRKSFKILPGVRLNISRKGLGTSVGVKGFHVSSGPSGKRMTTSIPGTGLSYSTKLDSKHKQSNQSRVQYTATGQVLPPVIRSPHHVKPFWAVFGIFSLLISVFMVLGAIQESSDMWIGGLIFLGVGLLCLLPWVRWAISKIIKLKTSNQEIPNQIDQDSLVIPPDDDYPYA